MGKIVKNKRFFYILTLFFIAVFLFYPNISLADEFDDITLRETAKHLELPGGKVQDLIRSFISIFHSEWENLAGSGSVTAEKMAVPSIMKKAVQVQALNHLLVDAPVETIGKIIKNTVKMTRLFLGEGFGSIFEEIEKESVKRAIGYGMGVLVENEIRMSPGPIEFEYKLREGGIKKALIQYIVIYKPSDAKNGEMVVRFYSVESLKPPKNEGSMGMRVGTYTELTSDLPPFIVEIRGNVQDYKWIGRPSVDINFPPEVPDLGIKPLNFWERHILKPIETTIKDVEVIITKVTGKSPGFTDIWNEFKKFIEKIKSFSPAGLTESPQIEENQLITDETLKLLTITETAKGLIEAKIVEDYPQQADESEITLAKLQEILDDAAEQIDVLSRQIAELSRAKLEESAELSQAQEQAEEQEVVKEEIEELNEEEELVEESPQQIPDGINTILCERVSQPSRSKVIFNEIAWMGTNNSANDEWIELRNISGTQVNLSSWQILDKEKQIKIIFATGTIPINGFLLLERTDEDSVPNVTADLIYSGGLNNTNEALYLFDQNCQLQDEVLANSNWPAGESDSKRTMERKSDLGWQTSLNAGGTPGRENSSGYTVQYTGGGGGSSPSPSTPPSSEEKPEITLSYSEESSVDKEIKVELSATTLKNALYDVKISIENGTTTLSEIYNENLNKWRSSSYYVTSTFSGTSFSGNFRLRIKQDENDFRGEADIFAKIRETGKTSIYLQFSGKIKITEPSQEQNQPPIASFTFSPQNPFISEEIIFDAASSTDSDGTITSYIWDFGDNATSTIDQATTTHGYSTSSDFLVNLTVVDNNNATSSVTTTINVSDVSEPEIEEPPILEVVINEIAWMGTATSSWDEWIELYNNTTTSVDLMGWQIKKDNEDFITIATSTTGTTIISDFYLLERNEKTTNITADFIYGGQERMNNDSCEILSLYNHLDQLIDKTACREDGKWPAGKASPDYISMERIDSNASGTDPTNWASNNLITRNSLDANGNKINGTPKAENSVSKSETEIFPANRPLFDEFDELTLTYLGSPYIFKYYLQVPTEKTLNIEPGVILKFDSAWGIEVSGTLKANGEENNKVIFTSLNEPACWNGIYFSASSTASELNWAEIKYARGSAGEGYPAIFVEDSSVIFKNSIIEEYYLQGIKLINSTSTIEKTKILGPGIYSEGSGVNGITISGGSPTILNCDLISGNEYGIYIQTTGVPQIEGNNFEDNKYPIYTSIPSAIFKYNRGENNQINGILVHDYIRNDMVWHKNEIPYIIYDFVTIDPGYSLTVNPGVTVKGYQLGTYGAYLEVDGKLMAEGTPGEPIVFTSYGGSWGGLTFSTTSQNSILKNVVVEYGGIWNPFRYIWGAVSVVGSSIEFIDSISNNSSKAGIYLENSSSTVDNSNFENNKIGIMVVGTESVPQMGNNTFSSNKECDICWTNSGGRCEEIATSSPGLVVECNSCP